MERRKLRAIEIKAQKDSANGLKFMASLLLRLMNESNGDILHICINAAGAEVGLTQKQSQKLAKLAIQNRNANNPCIIALTKYGDKWTSPCPSLQPSKGLGGQQFLCSEVLNANTPEKKKSVCIMIGGVGDESGCSSPMFNESRDAIRKRLIPSRI